MSAFAQAMIDTSHAPIMLIIGLAILFGTLGAKIFRRLHIPQVVGYITIGLIVGRSGLGLISTEALESLHPFNFFALGIIGFMIGGELRREVFRKYGGQFLVILFSEGMGAFVLVGLLTGGAALLVTGDLATSAALGLVFGALSAATAPAATVNVLWEYKARGVLTTAVFAIVALDDALALMLFSIAAGAAALLTGHGAGSLPAAVSGVAWELGGGCALGVAAGIVLNFILRRSHEHDNALTFIVGALALVIGIGTWIDVDVILASMVLGLTLTNLAPRRSRRAFETVERFAPPLYVLFFVVVGAHLDLQSMPAWMWLLALPYVVGRSFGKILGAFGGAKIARAPAVLGKYLGLCLFCQGGVAVGLSIVAAGRFPGEIGNAIIMIIAVTTFIVELVGSVCVKIAIKRAGEAGLNVTEEDLMATYKVGDVMDPCPPTFHEGTTLREILNVIARTDAAVYPVTDAGGRLTGVIGIQALKVVFNMHELTDFMVAHDVMQPVSSTVSETTPLADAMACMRDQGLDYLLVVASEDPDRPVGLLEERSVRRRLSQEILSRRAKADAT